VANILLIATPFDLPTSYGYFWMKKFGAYATRFGHNVILQRTPTLGTLHNALTTHNPRLVVINGHGGRKGVQVGNNVLIGVQDYDPELGVKIYRQNPDWFTGRIVILATCNTGKLLAYRLIDYGVEAVLAFKEPFIFLSDESASQLINDKTAEPFFISLFQASLHLVNGAVFNEACQRERDAFTYYRNLAEARGDELAAKYLHFDLENLVCLGNDWAKLTN